MLITKDELLSKIKMWQINEKTKRNYISLVNKYYDNNIEATLEQLKSSKYSSYNHLIIIMKKAGISINKQIVRQKYELRVVPPLSELYKKLNSDFVYEDDTTRYLFYLKILTGARVRTFEKSAIIHQEDNFYISKIKREEVSFILPNKLKDITEKDTHRYKMKQSQILKKHNLNTNVIDPIRKSVFEYFITLFPNEYQTISSMIIGHRIKGVDKFYISSIAMRKHVVSTFYNNLLQKSPLHAEVWNILKYL